MAFYGILWPSLAFYGLLWQNKVFSRCHRSKFICSCLSCTLQLAFDWASEILLSYLSFFILSASNDEGGLLHVFTRTKSNAVLSSSFTSWLVQVTFHARVNASWSFEIWWYISKICWCKCCHKWTLLIRCRCTVVPPNSQLIGSSWKALQISKFVNNATT